MGKAFRLYVILVSLSVLLVTISAPRSHSLASQPPIDTTRFVEGAIAWGPRRADPARAYDTGSGQLIFNVYENLIAWNKENYGDFVPMLATNVPIRLEIFVAVGNTSTVNADPTGSTWSGLGFTCVGFNDFNDLTPGFSQGDVLYMFDGTAYRGWYVKSFAFAESEYHLDLWRTSYTFHIRTTPTVNYVNETGATVDAFDVDDAVYALQRGLVQDQIGSPQWMFYKALFGTMNSDPWDIDNASRMQLANLINNAVEKKGTDLIINLGIPFPDIAFKQVLSNTWGGIVSKEFSTSMGCWDGNLLNPNSLGDPDWWNSSYVRRISRSPYDTTGSYKYVGTGPYYVSVFNQAGNQVVMQRNIGWWQGWPVSGNGNPYSTGYVDTVEIDYFADWELRRDAFVAGSIDTCAVPRAYMFQLLNNSTKEPDPSLSPYMKTIKAIIPTLSMDANHFTFLINSASPFIGTGSMPTGIPTNFFNNTNVRKAFAYSFNITQYTLSWYGEADYRKNVFILGLVPDFYNSSIPGYDINYTAAETELKAAVFPGGNVWSQGFTLTLTYDEGNDQRRIACEITRDFFNTLSTYNGRVGSPFTINIEAIDWARHLDLFELQELPIFNIGWLADFADADNFARPYMHSSGDFAFFQSYTADNGWGGLKDSLIDQALIETNNTIRQELYQQLQVIYSNDVPSYLTAIPQGRRWCQYWVKGWYYNAIFPGTYFPSVYKYDDCWYDLSGPTLGVQDGIVNMRDITWLLLHWSARAPIPGYPNDPRWIGIYGNGGVDPYGNRKGGEMRDVSGAILHFNHKNNTLTP